MLRHFITFSLDWGWDPLFSLQGLTLLLRTEQNRHIPFVHIILTRIWPHGHKYLATKENRKTVSILLPFAQLKFGIFIIKIRLPLHFCWIASTLCHIIYFLSPRGMEEISHSSSSVPLKKTIVIFLEENWKYRFKVALVLCNKNWPKLVQKQGILISHMTKVQCWSRYQS